MSTTALQTTDAPLAKNDIRSLLKSENFKQQVALALPRHMTPDRFARVALTALTRTPKLMECSRESLLKCLMDCSQLGLEPDGRHAHLIPYKDACTLIIDYKGLMALARRSGDVAVWRAELLKENDRFSWVNSTVSHEIDWRKDRGKTEAVYSYVKFKDGNEDWEVMTLSEVEAIRKRSRAGSSGPWVSDFDEMAKKTVIRRHSKRLTLSPEFCDALEKDDDRDERPAREVKSARVPLLAEKAGNPGEVFALDAPNEPALDQLLAKVDEAGMDRGRVIRILIENGVCAPDLASLADLPGEDASKALAQWQTITSLYE